ISTIATLKSIEDAKTKTSMPLVWTHAKSSLPRKPKLSRSQDQQFPFPSVHFWSERGRIENNFSAPMTLSKN
ncbi:hypothetical protein ACHAXS_009494, partial [Conticribra weissflogii]